MLVKNTNKESIMILGIELKINVIPITKKPTIIIMHNKRGSFCSGSFKGLKKPFIDKLTFCDILFGISLKLDVLTKYIFGKCNYHIAQKQIFMIKKYMIKIYVIFE